MSKLELKNFKELEKLLSPSLFKILLHRNVGKATKKVGLLAEAEIKRLINSGFFQNNSPVTIAMKGSRRPLVDTGLLSQSINAKQTSWNHVVIGVLKRKKIKGKSGKSKDLLNVAKILHEGVSIRVTKKMRVLFQRLSRENPNVKPIKASTKVIVIPRRPFLLAATTASQNRKYQEIWGAAVQKSLEGAEMPGK